MHPNVTTSRKPVVSSNSNSNHSKATAWHMKRRLHLIQNPKFEELNGTPWWTLASFVVVPGIHIGLAYFSTILEFWGIVLLAYTVGSLTFMYIFSNAHEVYHGALGKRFSTYRDIFMRFATLFDISSVLYVYYKYGHNAHHNMQGLHSAEEVSQKYLQKTMDLDPMTNFKNLYKMRQRDGEENRYKYPIMETNRWVRLLIVFLVPLFDQVKETITDPIKILKWYTHPPGSRARRVVLDAASQAGLVIAMMGLLMFCFGSAKFLIYFFFCRLFFLGFLHPYSLLWIVIHKAETGEHSYQPATSLYGWFVDFLCAGINLHVEHHDVPWVSRRKLRRVRQIEPKMYEKLTQFHGFRGAFRYIFRRRFDNVYAN